MLRSILPEWASMAPNAALGIALAGVSVLFQNSLKRTDFSSFLGRLAAFLATTLGLLTLAEYCFHASFGIDTWLVPARTNLSAFPFRGRMSFLTALDLVLVGSALLLMDVRQLNRHPISHWFAFIVALLTGLPLVGYLYGSPFHVGIAVYSDMAVHTALAFFGISLAIVFSRLNHDLAAVFISDGPGGYMARRLIFPSIIILLLLGWARVLAEEHHWLSATFGTATYTTFAIALMVSLIWRQCLEMQRSELDRRRIVIERDRLNIEGEMRDQFVSMLGHDLRTPLTNASARTQVIMSRARTLEDCRSSARAVFISLGRLDGMILDLLDASRIRAGRPVPVVFEDCDVSEVVRSAVDDLAFTYGDRFEVRLQSPVRAQCDRNAIRRIVENLCTNAVKYGARDGKIHVTLSIPAQMDSVRLSVHNSGAPIPAEVQERIFVPFERQGRHMGIKGWGLGLPLVRGIVEAHGGKIWLESSEASGTTFFVEFPVRQRQVLESA